RRAVLDDQRRTRDLRARLKLVALEDGHLDAPAESGIENGARAAWPRSRPGCWRLEPAGAAFHSRHVYHPAHDLDDCARNVPREQPVVLRLELLAQSGGIGFRQRAVWELH